MNTMRLLLTLGTLLICLQLNAKRYWVQVAAYGEKVSKAYFAEAGVNNVVQHVDRYRIYRYYLTGFSNEAEAETAKMTMVNKGFKYAQVVDIEALRKKCLNPCPESEEVEEEEELIETNNVREVNISPRKVETNQKDFYKKIYFNYDKSNIIPSAQEKLDKVIELLTLNPDLMAELEGHTDAHGSDRYNESLSKFRAYNAKNYLISKGIASKRVNTKALGEQQPVAYNATKAGADLPEGRKFNRRVEVFIFRKGEPRARISDAIRLEDVPESLRVR